MKTMHDNDTAPKKEEVIKDELWFINNIEKYNKDAIAKVRDSLKRLLADQKSIHLIKKLIQKSRA